MKVAVGIFTTLLVLLIGFAAVIRFDVAGLGTQVIGPSLVDVPVVNMILPEMPEEEVEGDVADYNFETVEEAVEILKITEKMLKESDDQAEILSEQITQLTAEVERLKIFEDGQVQFEKDKADFDALIAEESTAIDFKKWYETISPENAADIYSEVIQEVAYDEEMQSLINIYQSMKPAQAAAAIEEMSVTKMDQVATIIRGVNADQAADIMGNLQAETAAKITSYIYPQE